MILKHYLQLVVYFEIEKNVNMLGIFERKGRGDYHFIHDKAELAPDHLYYLYFRDKPDKSLIVMSSPGIDEETKRVSFKSITMYFSHEDL